MNQIHKEIKKEAPTNLMSQIHWLTRRTRNQARRMSYQESFQTLLNLKSFHVITKNFISCRTHQATWRFCRRPFTNHLRKSTKCGWSDSSWHRKKTNKNWTFSFTFSFLNGVYLWASNNIKTENYFLFLCSLRLFFLPLFMFLWKFLAIWT